MWPIHRPILNVAPKEFERVTNVEALLSLVFG